MCEPWTTSAERSFGSGTTSAWLQCSVSPQLTCAWKSEAFESRWPLREPLNVATCRVPLFSPAVTPKLFTSWRLTTTLLGGRELPVELGGIPAMPLGIWYTLALLVSLEMLVPSGPCA